MTEILKFHGAACKKVHLDSKDKGQREFWDYAMDKIANFPFAVIKFNYNKDNSVIVAQKVGDADNVKLGGFSTENTISPSICLMESATKITKKGDEYFIKFINEEEFAIFMHEFGHFDHLFVDRGEIHAPAFIGETITFDEGSNAELNEPLFKQEYEAGYRSMAWALKFGIKFKDKDIIKFTNVQNLWKFWISNGNDSFNEKMEKALEKANLKEAGHAEQMKFWGEKIRPQLAHMKWREFAKFDLDLSFINLEV